MQSDVLLCSNNKYGVVSFLIPFAAQTWHRLSGRFLLDFDGIFSGIRQAVRLYSVSEKDRDLSNLNLFFGCKFQ